jgi:hypothetical protein
MRFVSSLALIGVGSLLLLTNGCSSCSSDKSKTAGWPDAPATASAVSSSLLERMPASTRWALVIPNAAAFAKGFGGIRGALSAAIPGFRVMDQDFKNTIGADLGDAASLAKWGIPETSGVSFSQIGGANLAMLWVTDGDKFTTEVERVLTKQPYNYVANPQPATVGGMTFKTYTTKAPETRQAYLSIDKGLVRIIVCPTTNSCEPAIAAELAATAKQAAADPFVAKIVEEAKGESVFGWYDVSDRKDGTPPPDFGPLQQQMAPIMKSGGLVGASARMSKAGVDLRITMAPKDLAAAKPMLSPPANAVAPGFSKLFKDDAYAFVRLTTQFSDLLGTIRSSSGAAENAELEKAIGEADAVLGASIEKDLLPALGSAGVLFTTRAKILSLGSAKSAADFASALGAVAAWQVKDRAKIEPLFDKAVTLLEGKATKFSEGGATVLQFTDSQMDPGNIVLTDSLLLLVPDRDRATVLANLAAAAPAAGAPPADAAALLDAASANGLYLNIGKIAAGPIGQIFGGRLPAEIQTGLSMLDTLTIGTRYGKETFGADVHLGLLERAAAPEASGAPAEEASGAPKAP